MRRACVGLHIAQGRNMGVAEATTCSAGARGARLDAGQETGHGHRHVYFTDEGWGNIERRQPETFASCLAARPILRIPIIAAYGAA